MTDDYLPLLRLKILLIAAVCEDESARDDLHDLAKLIAGWADIHPGSGGKRARSKAAGIDRLSLGSNGEGGQLLHPKHHLKRGGHKKRSRATA